MLYRGDSLELLEQFEPQTFDLVFADPPYFLSNGGFTCKAGKRAPVGKGGWDESRGRRGGPPLHHRVARGLPAGAQAQRHDLGLAAPST